MNSVGICLRHSLSCPILFVPPFLAPRPGLRATIRRNRSDRHPPLRGCCPSPLKTSANLMIFDKLHSKIAFLDSALHANSPKPRAETLLTLRFSSKTFRNSSLIVANLRAIDQNLHTTAANPLKIARNSSQTHRKPSETSRSRHENREFSSPAQPPAISVTHAHESASGGQSAKPCSLTIFQIKNPARRPSRRLAGSSVLSHRRTC